MLVNTLVSLFCTFLSKQLIILSVGSKWSHCLICFPSASSRVDQINSDSLAAQQISTIAHISTTYIGTRCGAQYQTKILHRLYLGLSAWAAKFIKLLSNCAEYRVFEAVFAQYRVPTPSIWHSVNIFNFINLWLGRDVHSSLNDFSDIRLLSGVKVGSRAWAAHPGEAIGGCETVFDENTF